MKKVYPHDGGCWYCHTVAETGDWLVSWEFDCYLHAQCLRMAVDMWDSWETDILKNEFKEYLQSQVIDPSLVVVGKLAPRLSNNQKPKFKPGECFHRNINYLRKKNQWSIRCMATLIGISRSHAYCLEKGRRSASLEIVDRYSIVFNVSITNLLEQVFNDQKETR